VLVVLEGIDGAGKTTAARRLAGELPGAELLDRWSLPVDHNRYLARKMEQLRPVIWPPDLGSRPADDFGAHYWIFLQAAWYSVLERCLGARDGNRGGLAIGDGWWFRAVAKLAGSEAEREWMESLFAGVRKPDLTVLLDLAPQVAWGRREVFKSFELGRWAGHGGGPFESFCEYQGRIRENLLAQARRRGWVVLTQDWASTPEEVADRVLGYIREIDDGPRTAAGGRGKGGLH